MTRAVLKARNFTEVAPVLAIHSENSVVFSTKMIASTGFYWYGTPPHKEQVVVEQK